MPMYNKTASTISAFVNKIIMSYCHHSAHSQSGNGNLLHMKKNVSTSAQAYFKYFESFSRSIN